MEKLLLKQLNIKKLLLLLIIQLSAWISAAQVPRFMIPDAAILQYAGSIGYGSIGAGYNLFKDRGNLDVVYGFVPRSKGGSLHIATVKFAYKPFAIQLNKTATLYPVNPGVFFSYHIGNPFNLSWDDEYYEKGYYWWSPALRSHLSISNEAKFNTQKLLNDSGIKYFSIYTEFNTNDLYIVSWFKNRDTLSVFDIFKLGLGVRMYF